MRVAVPQVQALPALDEVSPPGLVQVAESLALALDAVQPRVAEPLVLPGQESSDFLVRGRARPALEREREQAWLSGRGIVDSACRRR